MEDLMYSKANDPYGIREMQLYLLDILIVIDKFCRDYNIQYSLNGGTLLGAVRHKGFIPWDDDADVMFDRENYKLFIVSNCKEGYIETFMHSQNLTGIFQDYESNGRTKLN